MPAKRVLSGLLLYALFAQLAMGQPDRTPATGSGNLPYMPSWQARHYLQNLVDEEGLQLTTSHWPLPADAVVRAIDAMRLPASDVEGRREREFVLREIRQQLGNGELQLDLRTPSEALTGFADNYTPGTSAQLLSPQFGGGNADGVHFAARLGAKVEVNSNSLSSANSGIGTDKSYQLRPEGSAAVVGWGGWNLQVTSQRYWWGPGWQSSMVNGSNNPAWTGLGLQRATVAPSPSPWLSWMGPWNLDVFVAKAQDPLVVGNQPQGFTFSGIRLTMRPQPWLELGFSRGMQAGGAGRPGGVWEFIKAFFGQEVNQNPGDPPDSSGQIGGFDARLRCPQVVGQALGGSCAAYGQIMGEDAVGKLPPVPYKFMSLWGLEQTYGHGRYRAFVEYANSNAYSLPWDQKPAFPGYVNGVYTQGYTQGARWVGPAMGSGSKVLTWGWLDAASQVSLRLHLGTIGTSIGAYDPGTNAPNGRMWGVSVARTFDYKRMKITTGLDYLHLGNGQDTGSNLRSSARVGLTVQVPMIR